MLSIQDLGALGELFGAIGVIVTLVYLGRQIRENSRQIRVSSITSMNHLINEGWDPIYSNDRNIRIWNTGLRAPAELEEEDLALFNLFMTRLINVLDTAVAQYNYDVLTSDQFEKYAVRLNSLLSSPGGKYWLAQSGGALVSERTRQTLAEYDVVELAGLNPKSS